MHQHLLNGVKIVDLSRILAGPWATQLLADLGADVIKIERPQTGDDTRSWGPPWLQDDAGNDTSESAYFLCCNRGKRSLTVNFHHPDGQKIIRHLIADADVLVENFRVGQLHKYGLDYATLSELNPKLIYCSITGFGQTGPECDRAGYDAMIQAMGGLMSVTGVADGEPGAGPQRAGVAITDLMCGFYAANAIQAALFHQARTGQGQHIDLALFDSQLACLANQGMNYLLSGQSPVRLSSAHPNIVPYQPFACADGHVVLAIGNDQQFARWCQVADCAQLSEDSRFKTNRARVENRATLLPLVAERMLTRSTVDWLSACEQQNVPCGPINTIEQAFAEPQALHRGVRVQMAHQLNPQLPQIANPLRFSETPVDYQRPPPTLGQHSEEILWSLGYNSAAVVQLRQHGVI